MPPTPIVNFFSKDVPTEIIFAILDQLENIADVIACQRVSRHGKACVDAYISDYLAKNEMVMRDGLIRQKQQSINMAEQYIKSLEDYKPIVLSEVFSLAAALGLVLATFLYLEQAQPDPELRHPFVWTTTVLGLGVALFFMMQSQKKSGYGFYTKITELSEQHRQEYRRLPVDVRRKFLFMFEVGFLYKPGDQNFAKNFLISRFISTLQQAVDDLKSEIKTIEKYPKWFQLSASDGASTSIAPLQAARVPSFKPIFPEKLMKDFQGFFKEYKRFNQARVEQDSQDVFYRSIQQGRN